MIVYTGNCDALVCVGSNDNGGLVLPCNTLGSKVSWCSTNGWDYFILVYGYSSTYFGNFVLNISDGELCAPPPNECLCRRDRSRRPVVDQRLHELRRH